MPPSFERLRTEDFADDNHRHISTMRSFLDDRNVFQWPEGLVSTDPKDPTVCYVDANDKPELERSLPWERRLNVAQKGNRTSVLEQRKFCPEWQGKTNFRRRFVVKEYITGLDNEMDEVLEAKNMKGLKHPHVAALLGTCSSPRNFWILSYPPGCCDLGDYMACISNQLGGKDWRGHPWKLLPQPRQEKEPRASQNHHEYCWPYRESLGQKLTRLRGYFVCLAQALDYLQTAGLRHRDIKPDNVIIDLSGSVVVVDFGLAKKFPPNTSHQSQSDTRRSFVVYQAPEVLREDPRDDPSDIFSLGCIFLEMASLILGKNLKSCEERCRFVRNNTWNRNYGDNLTGIARWIKDLKEVTQPATDGGLSPSPSEMISRLPKIEEMLSENPDLRPKAHGLWKSFDVSPEKRCRDCHPEHDEVWRPTQDQARATTVAAVDRAKRSLSSQYDESRLRESRELTMLARKAGVAGEPLLPSAFPSPVGSPRRGSFDPPVRSGSPALARRLTPRLEQLLPSGKVNIGRPPSEQNPHQALTLSTRLDAVVEQLVASSRGPIALSASPENHVRTGSERPMVKRTETPSLLSNEDFVVVEYGTGGSSEDLASKKEEKQVQFKARPVSIIPPTTDVPENSPQSSLDRKAGQALTPNHLIPETGAPGLRQHELIWPSKQPEIPLTSNEPPIKVPQPVVYSGNENILVYDKTDEKFFTNTTDFLRGKFNFLTLQRIVLRLTLSGRDPSQFVGFELPATGTEFHVYGQESDHLFTLNLSRVSPATKFARRWLNNYRSIYIINFAKKPFYLFDFKRNRRIPQKTP
jgi:serine/threonine protein kinase